MEQDLFTEFKKFLNKKVTVRYSENDKIIELNGILKFLNFNYLHCVVVMTESDKIIIKNIISIKRARDFKNE
jgi:small nuclear ribonucleoprotein (snRNP)-like protein